MLPDLILRSLFTIVPVLPPSALAALARVTARIEFLASSGRRRAVVSNLKQIARSGHGSVARPREVHRIARSIFDSYHRFLVEYFGQEALDTEALDGRFRFRGMELVYRALAEGRGAVVCAPHLGNWELAAIALSKIGYRVHVVTGVQFRKSWTGSIRAMKARQQILLSTPDEGYAPLLATLRGGGMVALLTDGDVYVRSLNTRFFGRAIPFPAGPAILARRARTPILHAHAEREPDGSHILSFDGVEHADPALPLEADLHRLTRRVAEAQERAVAAHLDQWCIFRPLFAHSDAA